VRGAILIDVYWLEQTEADVPLGDNWLGTSEIDRLKTIRFSKRLGDWRLGRWTAKNAVASYLGLSDETHSLAEIEIVSSRSGAPEVFLCRQPAEIAISLSHRAGAASAAITCFNIALGCDLEIIEPRSAAFLSDYFTAEEQSLIVGAGAKRDFVLSLLWSAKESALKALRAGLRMDTRCVSVYLSNLPYEVSEWQRLQVRHVSGQIFCGWWKESRGLVRTLVADRVLAPPTQLPILGGNWGLPIAEAGSETLST